MTRQLGLALSAGLLASLLFLSVAKGIAFGALLSYLSPLPLMVVGLSAGMAGSVIASVAGLSAVALVADGVSALPFLALAVLPTLVVTNRALLWRKPDNDGPTEWYPPGLILAWLAAAGLGMLLVGVSLISGSPGGLKGWVREILTHTLDLLASDLPPQAKDRAVEWWTPFFPAMIFGSWLLMTVLNAILAQTLVTRTGQAQRPRPPYGQLWLPDWLAVGIVLTGGIATIADGDLAYVAKNLAVSLAVCFSFLGLADIHRRSRGRKNARLVLAVVYGLLILASGWAIALLAGVGLVRFWTMRFRRPASGGGMEG